MKWHCPICGRPTDSESDPDFPLCGPRRRLLDLGPWASESDRVSEPAPHGGEAERPDLAHDNPPRST
ncbi:MAG: DNA gyrase inhibitor YacG [Terriglobia bacterium]